MEIYWSFVAEIVGTSIVMELSSDVGTVVDFVRLASSGAALSPSAFSKIHFHEACATTSVMDESPSL